MNIEASFKGTSGELTAVEVLIDTGNRAGDVIDSREWFKLHERQLYIVDQREKCKKGLTLADGSVWSVMGMKRGI